MGIVMAKGVVFGVISCVTILPAYILIFDKVIEKTTHRAWIPKMDKLSGFITKHYKVFILVFIVVLIPALYGYQNTKVYYNLDATLPKYLESIQANDKLSDQFDMNATHMVLAGSDLSSKDGKAMLNEMSDVEGVRFALGLDSVLGLAIPQEMIPKELTENLKKDNWQLILVQSEYKVASDEVNQQCEQLKGIIKKYDPEAMLIGEAPCTKDLITITDKDFKVVSAVSIAAVFLIILFVFKSISLPVILVAVIEFAIFINLGIPYYTGTQLPFIASIVIGTIQLGATVDYAILFTNKYLENRRENSRWHAARITVRETVVSILTSGSILCIAGSMLGALSTNGVISQLGYLVGRGAVLSCCMVLFVLPTCLCLFDGLVQKTSLGLRFEKNY